MEDTTQNNNTLFVYKDNLISIQKEFTSSPNKLCTLKQVEKEGVDKVIGLLKNKLSTGLN